MLPDGSSERPRGGVTYVNIPISPPSKKQLHYMELELQEHGGAIRGKNTKHGANTGVKVMKMADEQV